MLKIHESMGGMVGVRENCRRSDVSQCHQTQPFPLILSLGAIALQSEHYQCCGAVTISTVLHCQARTPSAVDKALLSGCDFIRAYCYVG